MGFICMEFTYLLISLIIFPLTNGFYVIQNSIVKPKTVITLIKGWLKINVPEVFDI